MLDNKDEEMIAAKMLREQRAKYVDSLYWTPAERAQGVHNLIANFFRREEEKGEEIPSDLDMLCYAIVGIMFHVGQILENEEFENITRAALKWLYDVHYTNAEKMYPNIEKDGTGKPIKAIRKEKINKNVIDD